VRAFVEKASSPNEITLCDNVVPEARNACLGVLRKEKTGGGISTGSPHPLIKGSRRRHQTFVELH
jgi:hypothetical protein